MNHSRKLYFIILLTFLGYLNSILAQEIPKSEFRAVWLTTVGNADWPKGEHRNQPELQKEDLIRLLDFYVSINLNAVLLQVRTECDAFYNSAYEPWSRYLTWAQGDDPGYDPLQFAIEEAHKRGLELHAWLNPYRLNASLNPGEGYFHPSHIYSEHPEWAIEYSNGRKILNPGRPEVMSYIGGVIRDIVSKYDIDGIHFDDYFYYDPTLNTHDQTEYDLYGSGMSRADWRRDNVNRMIDTVYRVIQEENPNIRFGISPFGIYRPGVPPGISGWDTYNAIYCDPLAWLEDQTVDYINPQLYWPTGGAQDFETLANWWSEQAKSYNRHFYAGHGIYKYFEKQAPLKIETIIDEDKLYFDRSLEEDIHDKKKYFDNQNNLKNLNKGTSDPVADWTLEQVGLQIDIVRSNQSNNGLGSVYFRSQHLETFPGLPNYLAENKYLHKALVPEMTWKSENLPVSPTHIEFDGEKISWQQSSGSGSDRFAIYQVFDYEDRFEVILDPGNLNRVVFENEIALSDLDYYSNSYLVITALNPFGTEGEPSDLFMIEWDWPTVELVTPENEQVVRFDDTLKWQSENSEAEFFIEFSVSQSFNNIFYSTGWTTDTSLVIEDLALNGEQTIYWRAKAKTNIEGPFCQFLTFITGYPETPELLYPAQLGQNISRLPVIKWNSSEATDSIRVLISESIDFSTIEQDINLYAGEGQGIISDSLNRETWYYLKIAGKNDFGQSHYTNYVSFKTTVGEIPNIVIISPDNEATVASYDSLKWETTTTIGSITYLFELSTDISFNNIYYTTGWTSSKFVIINKLGLEGGLTYYWRLKAKSEFGESEYTDIRSFVTGFPTKPSILQPAHLTSGISVYPTIEWLVDDNTDSVYIEISKDIEFSVLTTNESFLASLGSTTLTFALENETWYYLQMSARNDFGYSLFSSKKIFETEPGNSITDLKDNEFKVIQNNNSDILVYVNNTDNSMLEINVYSILGNLIYSNKSSADIHIIDRSVFSSNGIYLVSVAFENQYKTTKIRIK